MRRPIQLPFYLLSLLAFLLFSSLHHLGWARDVKQFDVGVILDNTTWIGNISWSCMAMAIDDFYAAHKDYTTRINLHPRDTSKDDSVGAASAAIDLLKNVEVQAIIGPQSTEQAKFVIELGNKSNVPIISFSAKSPSLSHQHSPYFIRTAFNDSSQAKVMASIVKAYGWREVVLVFEETDYGNGIIPYLTDALQEIDARVPYRSSIPLAASQDQISGELQKLRNMQTRVFIVHMSYALGFKFFVCARDAGMMEEGYVWMTTYGLIDIVDLMGSPATSVMQGVLGVKPYVRETEKFRDFKLRWKKKFHKTNPDGQVIEPTVFGLWAYDTVWLLALAAKYIDSATHTFSGNIGATKGSTDLETLGSSSTGPTLLAQILRTNFTGMSGRIYLADGQLEAKIFEIINVRDGKKRIGFWTETHGVSRDVNGRGNLSSVVWPGKTRSIPKGWEWPIKGKTLTIGVPVKPGFMEFVNMTVDPWTKKKGYCLEVFDAVMQRLPYKVSYNYTPYEDGKGASNGTYDELVYEVYLKKYDAVVGDVTIIANRSLYVDFTLPYTESGVSMLVPIKDKRKKGALTFLDPLTTDLWLGSGAFFIFTGFVVWILEHRINDDFRGQPTQQLGTVFYFSFSTLVFAHREKILNNLSRIVVIIWVFVVLILQSSYTASLTSMLTAQLQPAVADLDELIKNGYSVGYLNDSFLPGFLKTLHFNTSKLIAYDSPEDYHAALSNGTVAAIVDETKYIKVFLSKYCSKYTMAGRIYKTDGFGFVFPKGSPLVPDISRAILQLAESNIMAQLENEILYRNKTCPDPGDSATTSSSLTFSSFRGLFLLTGVASMSAMIWSLASFLYKHRDALRASGSEKSSFQRIILLAKLFDQKETSSTETKDEQVRDGNMATSHSNTAPPSPSSISTRVVGDLGTEDDIGSQSEDEGTPGREIGSRTPDPLSFSEMLNTRN